MGKVKEFLEDKKTKISNYIKGKKKDKEALEDLHEQYNMAKNARVDGEAEIYHRREKDGTLITTILSQSGSLEVSYTANNDGSQVTRVTGVTSNGIGGDRFVNLTRTEGSDGNVSYSGAFYEPKDDSLKLKARSGFYENQEADPEAFEYNQANGIFYDALDSATKFAPGLSVIKPEAPYRPTPDQLAADLAAADAILAGQEPDNPEA